MAFMKGSFRWILLSVMAAAVCTLSGPLADGRSAEPWMFAVSVADGPSAESQGDLKSEGDPALLEKWRSFTESERKSLLRKYRRFKALPDEEKNRLRDRHRKLEVIRESLAGEGPGAPGDRPEERRSSVERRIKQYLEQCESELARQVHLPPAENVRDRAARIRNLRGRLEQLNTHRLGGFLRRLVKEGIITEGEADRIRAMPEGEIKEKIFDLGKRRFLKDMEGLVSHQEVKRLERMESWRFHRMMRSEQERWGMARPVHRLLALTPEQQKILEGIGQSEERERTKKGFFEANLRSRLGELGVDPSTVEQVLSMKPHERQRWIMMKLKSWKEEEQPLPPAIQRLLEDPAGSRIRQGPGDKERRSQNGPRRRTRQGDEEGHRQGGGSPRR